MCSSVKNYVFAIKLRKNGNKKTKQREHLLREKSKTPGAVSGEKMSLFSTTKSLPRAKEHVVRCETASGRCCHLEFGPNLIFAPGRLAARDEM